MDCAPRAQSTSAIRRERKAGRGSPSRTPRSKSARRGVRNLACWRLLRSHRREILQSRHDLTGDRLLLLTILKGEAQVVDAGRFDRRQLLEAFFRRPDGEAFDEFLHRRWHPG